jgi:hypothetical protein
MLAAASCDRCRAAKQPNLFRGGVSTASPARAEGVDDKANWSKGSDGGLVVAQARVENDVNSVFDCTEEAELARAPSQSIPSSLAQLKAHPLYCAEVHLKATECVFPNTQHNAVGKLKSGGETHLVFLRNKVQTLRTRDQWRREGRQVKDGLLPHRTRGMRELYGMWQTEEIETTLREEKAAGNRDAIGDGDGASSFVPASVRSRFGSVDVRFPSLFSDLPSLTCTHTLCTRGSGRPKAASTWNTKRLSTPHVRSARRIDILCAFKMLLIFFVIVSDTIIANVYTRLRGWQPTWGWIFRRCPVYKFTNKGSIVAGAGGLHYTGAEAASGINPNILTAGRTMATEYCCSDCAQS